jgi:hypothetical protein
MNRDEWDMPEIGQKVWVERPNGQKFVGTVVREFGLQLIVEFRGTEEIAINPYWDDCRLLKLDEEGACVGEWP